VKYSAPQINNAIAGFTDVVELSIPRRRDDGDYNLAVTLTNSDAVAVRLECFDISSLSMLEIGGGLPANRKLPITGRAISPGFQRLRRTMKADSGTTD
jgi:hypothetical protein